MSWSKLSLSTPNSIPELSQCINVMSVSPWTHGVKEGSGNHTWLSFPNAVKAISEQIDESKSIFAIAISAANIADFVKEATALNAILKFKV